MLLDILLTFAGRQVIKMKKEIDVNEIVPLPTKILKKKIDDFFIVLAPDYPNWIVLDDTEKCLYNEIESKKNNNAGNGKYFRTRQYNGGSICN